MQKTIGKLSRESNNWYAEIQGKSDQTEKAKHLIKRIREKQYENACLKEENLQFKASYQQDKLMNDPFLSPDILNALEEKENLQNALNIASQELNSVHESYLNLENEHNSLKSKALNNLADIYDNLIIDKEKLEANDAIDSKQSNLPITSETTLMIPSADSNKVDSKDLDIESDKSNVITVSENNVDKKDDQDSDLATSRTISFVYSTRHLSSSRKYEQFATNINTKSKIHIIPTVNISSNFQSFAGNKSMTPDKFKSKLDKEQNADFKILKHLDESSNENKIEAVVMERHNSSSSWLHSEDEKEDHLPPEASLKYWAPKNNKSVMKRVVNTLKSKHNSNYAFTNWLLEDTMTNNPSDEK